MPGSIGNRNAAKTGPRFDREVWNAVHTSALRRLPDPVAIAQARVDDAEKLMLEHWGDLAYHAALDARKNELEMAAMLAARKVARG